MVKKKFSLFVVIAVMLVILAACSKDDGEGTGEKDKKPAESSKDKITVYVGFQEDHAIEAMRQFTEDTGIEAEMIRMSGGEIFAKILAEKENPQASIWYGGPADTFIAAKDQDLLEPYISPEASKIDERYKDAEGYWTGIYTGALGFAYNKDFIEKNNLEPPKSWEDLLDPIYKDEIVMGDPSSSGTAYTVMYTILKVMGDEEKGFDYLKQLHGQIQQYPTSSLATGRMVGMGEAAVGLIFAHDIVKYQEEGFESLGISFPEEGTGYETGSIGIINNNKTPELSKKFVDWALSTNAQEVGQRTGSYQSLTNKDAKQPEKAIDFSQLNLINYDPVEAGQERQRIIEKWNKEVK